jgi:hypothetical protein
MQQSSALRRLVTILVEAINSGNPEESAGHAILNAMSLEARPKNIMAFFELLKRAEDEAGSIRNNPMLNMYLQRLGELYERFTANHIWGSKWAVFSSYIESTSILLALDGLTNYFHQEHPSIFLEEVFLERLTEKLNELHKEILQADLSPDLKNFLIDHIEKLRTATSRYQIDGTEGLKNAAQALFSDLVLTEQCLEEKEKSNPVYLSIKAVGIAFLLWLRPSPYDIIGVIPDIQGYWVPRFEEFNAGFEKVKGIIKESSGLEEILEKSAQVFDKTQQKYLAAGKDFKALPPGEDEPEAKSH